MDSSLSRHQQLRRQPTEAESVLWSHLRDGRLTGFKFRRQHPCGPFLLDFYCVQARLAVEVDGQPDVGPGTRAYHDLRARYLAAQGIAVLPFTGHQVVRDTETVLMAIAAALLVEGR